MFLFLCIFSTGEVFSVTLLDLGRFGNVAGGWFDFAESMVFVAVLVNKTNDGGTATSCL